MKEPFRCPRCDGPVRDLGDKVECIENDCGTFLKEFLQEYNEDSLSTEELDKIFDAFGVDKFDKNPFED